MGNAASHVPIGTVREKVEAADVPAQALHNGMSWHNAQNTSRKPGVDIRQY
jgi:hypothetical protein